MQSTSVSAESLQQIYTLLHRAASSADSESQKEVYQHLSTAEENAEFYLGLIAIAYNNSVEVRIRQMAMLTLKSALKRNEMVVAFGEQEMGYIRQMVIGGKPDDDRVVANVSKSLVSMMALWGKQIDFAILNYLLQELNSEDGKRVSWALETLKIIFEDIRFETENISCFDKPQFSQFLTQFSQTFSSKMKSVSPEIGNKYLAIMNLLLKYTHTQTHSQLPKHYLAEFLVRVLVDSQNTPAYLIETALQGMTEIMEISPQVILASQPAMSIILNYSSEVGEVVKKWLGLVYDIVSKDSEEERVKPYLQVLAPKIIRNLIYTKQDEINVKLQLQEENNPYHYEIKQEEEQQNEGHNLLGYTRRKLAVLILKELFTWHTHQIWGIVLPCLESVIGSQNLVERECGVLMVGIVYEITEEHLDFLWKAVPVIMANIGNSALPPILSCTSLWALGKVAYLVIRDEVLNAQIQAQLMKCLNDPNGQIRDTVYATLDQFVRCNEELPANLDSIAMSIVEGVRVCQGKTLYSVLKICSTLYERHPGQIPEQITSAILKQLCLKWSQHAQVQSIMSPILQCLVTIASSSSKVFNSYAYQIFKQTFGILQNEHQKTVALRAIDLLSSIISTNNPEVNSTLVSNGQLHSKLISLLTNEENEIRNFSYGLVGDITKVVELPAFAEGYVQAIGTTFNQNSLTSCSNALTCLTDLIVRHPGLAGKYGRDVMTMAIKKININNLQAIYGFNFARIYGRLGNVCPNEGAPLLDANLKQISTFLRAQEYQKLTDEAYRGLFKMIQQNPQGAAKSFDHLVQSFLCYPCQDKQVENTFLSLLKAYRSSLGSQGWASFLGSTIFLPAMAKKIDLISS